MKTICVGGTSSNCGKTTVTCLLLRAFPGWAAIKVTPCRPEDTCPRGDGCGACRAPASGYEVVTDSRRLDFERKDTARFHEAGANGIAWVRALPELLPEAMELAMRSVAGAEGVIVESTTAMHLIDGMRVMVTPQDALFRKESARRAPRVDLTAINLRPEELSVPRPRETVGATSVIICAVLPPEHAVNQEFLTRVSAIHRGDGPAREPKASRGSSASGNGATMWR